MHTVYIPPYSKLQQNIGDHQLLYSCSLINVTFILYLVRMLDQLPTNCQPKENGHGKTKNVSHAIFVLNYYCILQRQWSVKLWMIGHCTCGNVHLWQCSVDQSLFLVDGPCYAGKIDLTTRSQRYFSHLSLEDGSLQNNFRGNYSSRKRSL